MKILPSIYYDGQWRLMDCFGFTVCDNFDSPEQAALYMLDYACAG